MSSPLTSPAEQLDAIDAELAADELRLGALGSLADATYGALAALVARLGAEEAAARVATIRG